MRAVAVQLASLTCVMHLKRDGRLTNEQPAPPPAAAGACAEPSNIAITGLVLLARSVR